MTLYLIYLAIAKIGILCNIVWARHNPALQNLALRKEVKIMWPNQKQIKLSFFRVFFGSEANLQVTYVRLTARLSSC